MLASPARNAQTPGARSYITPMTPSDSNRSREGSWSSVLFTPYKAARVQGDGQGHDADAPIQAPSATQRSARRYCSALVVSAVAGGCAWSAASPALLVIFGDDWRLLALARFCLGLGALLPPSAPFRSVRVYLRTALHARVLVLLVALPAVFLVMRSHVEPLSELRFGMSGATAAIVFAAATCTLLALDAAAAAVPAAVGGREGFRLEEQLLHEYSVCVPPSLLGVLQVGVIAA